MNSQRIYELAEDPQGYSYCEAMLAECEIEGPKVSLVLQSELRSYSTRYAKSIAGFRGRTVALRHGI